MVKRYSRLLSPRLEAVLSFVEGRVLADIGTDHGYLPIVACLAEKIEYAIACDANAGPLERAAENILRYGLDDRIQARLGFGLRPIMPKEADCLVIAGMGGMNIIEILKDQESLLSLHSMKRLIIQPQRDIIKVRHTLDEMGFSFVDEVSVREKHRFYSVIAVNGMLHL